MENLFPRQTSDYMFLFAGLIFITGIILAIFVHIIFILFSVVSALKIFVEEETFITALKYSWFGYKSNHNKPDPFAQYNLPQRQFL